MTPADDPVVDLPQGYQETTMTYPRTLAEAEQRRRLWAALHNRRTSRRSEPMARYLDDEPPAPGWVWPLGAAIAIVAVLAVVFGEIGWANGGWL